MKNFLTLFLFCLSAYVQAQNELAYVSTGKTGNEINATIASIDSLLNKAEAEQAKSKSSSLKKTGLILLGSGLAITAGGIVIGIIEGGFSYSYQNTNGYVTESGSPAAGLAGVMVCCGIPTAVGGLVCTLVGKSKEKKEKQKEQKK